VREQAAHATFPQQAARDTAYARCAVGQHGRALRTPTNVLWFHSAYAHAGDHLLIHAVA